MATQTDADAQFFDAALTTNSSFHTGTSPDKWKQMVADAQLDGTPSKDPEFSSNRDPPVKAATGRMRPSDEWRPVPGARPSGLSTYKPSGLKPIQIGVTTNEGIEKLVATLAMFDAKQGATGRLVPNDLRRACQQVLLNLDDREITQCIKSLRPDKTGRIEIASFLTALHGVADEADKPNKPVSRLWDPSPPSQLSPSKMLAAKVPSHPISANDFAALMSAKASNSVRQPRDGDSLFVGRGKPSYDMLPSCPGAVRDF